MITGFRNIGEFSLGLGMVWRDELGYISLLLGFWTVGWIWKEAE